MRLQYDTFSISALCHLVKSPHHALRYPGHLLNEPRREGRPAGQQAGPTRHLARLLLRRQDRRARPERRGQVGTAAHHGGRR